MLSLYLLYPTQLIYTQVVMSEIMLQTLLLLSLFFLTLFLTRRRNRYLLFMNLCLSLAMLTKGVLVFFWIPNLAFHLWLLVRTHRKEVVLLALIPVLTVFCWSYRNYLRIGFFQFSSISTKTYSFLMRQFGEVENDAFARGTRELPQQPDDYATRERGVERSLMKVLAKNWQRYAVYHLRGMLFFFLDPGRFDIYQVLGWSQGRGFAKSIDHAGGGIFRAVVTEAGKLPTLVLILLTLVGTANLLILGAFIYFVFKPHVHSEFKLFLILMVLYVAFVTAGIGRSRYRLPVMPYLLLTAPAVLAACRTFEVTPNRHH